mmetsp:Transcript_122152/g.211914  ORF Transcript_122152/g.211914 Transcript_122152/m.211914 type:complete len:270 (-) Transcript_122152:1803-2612(-)
MNEDGKYFTLNLVCCACCGNKARQKAGGLLIFAPFQWKTATPAPTIMGGGKKRGNDTRRKIWCPCCPSNILSIGPSGLQARGLENTKRSTRHTHESNFGICTVPPTHQLVCPYTTPHFLNKPERPSERLSSTESAFGACFFFVGRTTWVCASTSRLRPLHHRRVRAPPGTSMIRSGVFMSSSWASVRASILLSLMYLLAGEEDSACSASSAAFPRGSNTTLSTIDCPCRNRDLRHCSAVGRFDGSLLSIRHINSHKAPSSASSNSKPSM